MENKNLRTSILPQASGLRTRAESGGCDGSRRRWRFVLHHCGYIANFPLTNLTVPVSLDRECGHGSAVFSGSGYLMRLPSGYQSGPWPHLKARLGTVHFRAQSH